MIKDVNEYHAVAIDFGDGCTFNCTEHLEVYETKEEADLAAEYYRNRFKERFDRCEFLSKICNDYNLPVEKRVLQRISYPEEWKELKDLESLLSEEGDGDYYSIPIMFRKVVT